MVLAVTYRLLESWIADIDRDASASTTTGTVSAAGVREPDSQVLAGEQ